MACEVGLHERAGHDRGEVSGRVHRLKNRLTEPLQIGSLIPGALLIHLNSPHQHDVENGYASKAVDQSPRCRWTTFSHTHKIGSGLISLMAGECRVGTEVGVANSAEGLSHRSRRRFVA